MTHSAFAERLMARMDEMGMNMAQLSEESGVPYHQIHTWKRRENAQPKAESLNKIAKVLAVTPEHLLYGEPLPDLASRIRSELQHELSRLSEEELRVLLAAAKAMRAPPLGEGD